MLEDLLTKDICKRGIESRFAPTDMKALMEEYGVDHMDKLIANENPLGMSPKAKEAMIKELERGHLYGNDVSLLMDRIIHKNHFDDAGLDVENVLITSGATQALALIMEIFIGKGDEVLYCAPTYQNYDSAIMRSGGSVKSIPLLENNHQDLKGLLKAISEKTKVVLVCNPNNPTGIVESVQDMKNFIKRFPDDKILVIDEAYIQFAPGGYQMSMYDEITKRDNIIITHTFSKLYGMAGIRIGYILASHQVIEYMNRYFGFKLPRTNVAAAIGALDDDEFIERTLENNEKGRKYLIDELRKMGYEPTESATNFVYCNLGDPQYLADELMKRGTLIRGNLALTRISVGTMEQNERCIQAIKEVLGK